MICKKCGRENPRESAICANCGEALTWGATLEPGVASSLSYGWRVMWKNFWGLFFTVFVYLAFSVGITIGSWLIFYLFTHRLFSFSLAMTRFDADRLPWEFELILIGINIIIGIPLLFGVFSVFFGLVRGEGLKFSRLLDGFRNFPSVILVSISYNIVFSGILFLIGLIGGQVFGLGIFLLIVWLVVSLWIICKLVFVPFLITDRKMKGFESIRSSWSLSEGHAGQAFGIGFVFFLIALGLWLIAWLLGILISSESAAGYYVGLSIGLLLVLVFYIWFTSAFTSLYYAVSVVEKETGPENRPALTS